MMKDQITENLLAKAVLGDLSPEESDSLLEACRGNVELRRRLMRLLQVERMVGLALERDDDVFIREFCFRAGAKDDDVFSAVVASRLKKNRMLKLVAGWSVAAVVAICSFLLLNPSKDEAIAKVVRMEAADFSGEDMNLEIGERVVFDEGLVEIFFSTGVKLVLEAPVDFEVTGENQGFLHYGKLVAEVNDETAHGFVIDGPSGRLVDLGTSFAVAVDVGGEMEVHVIEGRVDATATGGETSRLIRNEAMRLVDGEGVRVVADVGKFVTRMPDYRDEPPRSVRWTFDEAKGTAVFDTGNILAGGAARGQLKSFSGEGEGPQRVKGKFGRALAFDGNDAFVETGFAGVTGRSPRTVAFWVKTPEDFNPMQGYGIINWGDVTVPGGAWQISVNGTEVDGPLGRLRIGTHWGQVIGTSDLRDGQWHHCAVVMYGDEAGKPNTATHVLLYVDGKLEPAARKSMQVVDTVEPSFGGPKSHGVWMGRNLGFDSKDSPSVRRYGKFFRGTIDEMVICDIALSREKIVRLLEFNELPEE
ncbi:MAG: LamG-like jellyroll fold domain-containing protein [Akkermansiaceae bacterium]